MIVTNDIELQTNGMGAIIDITGLVRVRVGRSGLTDGIVTLFITGSTAALATMEFEPGLVMDMNELWDKLVPAAKSYQHDQTWKDANGYAHLRSSLLGPSLVIPFRDGNLTLGTWQQVVVIDFDNRPRTRQIATQIMGEKT
jgi:secondary thiamine-phosphate synthase enzyme